MGSELQAIFDVSKYSGSLRLLNCTWTNTDARYLAPKMLVLQLLLLNLDNWDHLGRTIGRCAPEDNLDM